VSVAPIIELGRRGGWIAVDKPAGLPTEPAPGFAECVLERVAEDLNRPCQSLHAVNRLDVGVSGVVLIALDASARLEAAALTRGHLIDRRYLGLTVGCPRPDRGIWNAPIGRGRGRRVVRGSAAEPAVTAYAYVARAAGVCLLAFAPRTGKTHQIRAHSAAAGVPMLFDRRYGGAPRIALSDGRVVEISRIALHAARMRVPLAAGLWDVRAPPPLELSSLWASLGGAPGAFDDAMEVSIVPWQAA
jgi:23S rRNA-/tRNA-specific pseudouridylate synthase